jgi:hypothetical protein
MKRLYKLLTLFSLRFILGCVTEFFGVYLITTKRRKGDQEQEEEEEVSINTTTDKSSTEDNYDEHTPLLQQQEQPTKSIDLPKRSKLFRGISLSSQLARMSDDNNTIEQEHCHKSAPPTNLMQSHFIETH